MVHFIVNKYLIFMRLDAAAEEIIHGQLHLHGEQIRGCKEVKQPCGDEYFEVV